MSYAIIFFCRRPDQWSDPYSKVMAVDLGFSIALMIKTMISGVLNGRFVGYQNWVSYKPKFLFYDNF